MWTAWLRGSHTMPMFTGKSASTRPGWDMSAETTRNHSKQSPQGRNPPSRKSLARDRRRAIKRKRRTGFPPKRIESQLLRLACRPGSMSWCDGGIRLAFRLYLHCFCKAVGRSIRLESRIGFGWFCDCCHDRWSVLSLHRTVDRSFRPPAHHSSLHDGVWLRHCLTGAAGFRVMAFLSDLLCDRRGWQRSRAPGLRSLDFDLVSAAIGYGTGLRNGRSRSRRHDPAGHRAVRRHSIWLEGRLPFARRDCVTAGTAAQLALHHRSWSKAKTVRASCSFRTHLAARHAHACFLDRRRRSFCELDQHERR